MLAAPAAPLFETVVARWVTAGSITYGSGSSLSSIVSRSSQPLRLRPVDQRAPSGVTLAPARVEDLDGCEDGAGDAAARVAQEDDGAVRADARDQ